MISFKWSQVRSQVREVWDIENKINSGTPYESSLNGTFDPLALRMKHERYARGPGIVRAYRPLDDIYDRQDRLHHAVDTSVCLSTVLLFRRNIVFALYDVEMSFVVSEYASGNGQPRATTIPCFQDDKDNTDTEIQLVRPDRNEDLGRGMPILTIMSRILSDQDEVLSIMKSSMDGIELGLANDKMLRTFQPLWRKRILHWKNHLHHMKKHLEDMKPALQEFIFELEPEDLDIELGDVQIWIWVATSATVLLTTYILLYRQEIGRTASHLPQYLGQRPLSASNEHAETTLQSVSQI
ncbi:hypothetical protein F503_08705 [Ophiostoma piceae UAMH 11346]|uniref:Uncharacterized protein n=1 Tax=Ophiostoma piceae (strain UAMH 11346) TaxID=1262450 RepID=S3BUI1_OPHP1|nr:hypothetical protein F503_08705 [Ophiostoma piceae UAMH 11346]